MFGSSSGLGLRPFTAATRVRVPYRMPQLGALVQLVRIQPCHGCGHGFESHTHRHYFLG